MSDEDQTTLAESAPVSNEVDGITPNGVNSFTSKALCIAIVIKPKLTAGDLEKWLGDFKDDPARPSLVDRLILLRLASKAGIIMHATDKIDADLDGDKANWYGNQLIRIHNRYQVISPN